jgi:O-antigen ligase
VYLTAASLPFSLAATNISKVFMVVWALVALGIGFARRERLAQLSQFRAPFFAVLMLAALGASLLYTQAPLDDALYGITKYGKLLILPLVLLLVRDRREALIALRFYLVVQLFVVGSSYLLEMGLHLPWVIKPMERRLAVGVVFSGYLDQSVMTAGAAALCWHLRREFPGRHGIMIAIGLAALCAVNVLLLLPGRSGQLALVVALALALYWATPGRGRPIVVLAPLLLVAGIMLGSTHFRDRVTSVVTESIAYSNGDRAPTSSGIRLTLWHSAIQAIAERPVIGFGVGSWNTEFHRLAGPDLPPHLANIHNPHQEYLMWAVQLGLAGLALLLAFMLAIVRDAQRARIDVRHATLSMLAILATVCLFNATLFDALIGDYFCVMLGILLALVWYSPAEPLAGA